MGPPNNYAFPHGPVFQLLVLQSHLSKNPGFSPVVLPAEETSSPSTTSILVLSGSGVAPTIDQVVGLADKTSEVPVLDR